MKYVIENALTNNTLTAEVVKPASMPIGRVRLYVEKTFVLLEIKDWEKLKEAIDSDLYPAIQTPIKK